MAVSARLLDYQVFGVLLIGYIGTSYTLIVFNKKLMTSSFPYPCALGCLHGMVCSSLSLVMFMVKPELFTTLNDPERRSAMLNAGFIVKVLFPIACMFAAEIVLGNNAYRFMSIGFLQMLKETNVVTVYLLSLAFGMERFSWLNFKMIGMILVASVLTIEGELSFQWIGFFLQLGCCLVGSLKCTFTGLMLSGKGMKLDALSYLILVMPICTILFTFALLVSAAMGGLTWMPVPSVADVVAVWPVLIPNSLLAFALNVICMFLIQVSSSVTFVLCGLLKDLVIVLGSSMFLGEQVGTEQAIAFSVLLALLCLWSYMKVYPDMFQDGLAKGIVGQANAFYGSVFNQAAVNEKPAIAGIP